MFGFFAALTEFERELIVERTAEGVHGDAPRATSFAKLRVMPTTPNLLAA